MHRCLYVFFPMLDCRMLLSVFFENLDSSQPYVMNLGKMTICLSLSVFRFLSRSVHSSVSLSVSLAVCAVSMSVSVSVTCFYFVFCLRESSGI